MGPAQEKAARERVLSDRPVVNSMVRPPPLVRLLPEIDNGIFSRTSVANGVHQDMAFLQILR